MNSAKAPLPTLPRTHILQLLCSELHCCHLPKGNRLCIASALSHSFGKCHPVVSPLKQTNVWFLTKMALESRQAVGNRCIWIYWVWSGVSGTLKMFPKLSDQCPRPSWQSVTQSEGEGPPHLEWSLWGVRWSGDARFKFLKSFHSSNGLQSYSEPCNASHIQATEDASREGQYDALIHPREQQFHISVTCVCLFVVLIFETGSI